MPILILVTYTAEFRRHHREAHHLHEIQADLIWDLSHILYRRIQRAFIKVVICEPAIEVREIFRGAIYPLPIFITAGDAVAVLGKLSDDPRDIHALAVFTDFRSKAALMSARLFGCSPHA